MRHRPLSRGVDCAEVIRRTAPYIRPRFRGCKNAGNDELATSTPQASSGAAGAGPHDLNGALIYPGRIAPEEQVALVDDLRAVAEAAPFFTPVTPRGQPMSVRMTSAGRCGWVSDRAGYRYDPRHPCGVAWPPIPARLLWLWRDLLPDVRDPDCCLVNFYSEGARMGLHQDRDEADLTQPVLSVSLGDAALFRVGGTTRGGSTRSHWLASGDVVVLAGAARMAFHGIDRIRFGSSGLLPRGGRINLTLRIVT